MTLPLLGEIERLINEHGSAVILKERLALAAEQYAALQNENETLKSENERLRLDNDECQKKKRALEEKLSHTDIPKTITGKDDDRQNPTRTPQGK